MTTIGITEEQARMIGRAIRDEAKLIAIPIENDTERRAICLKLAIDTKVVSLSLKSDPSPTESAEQVVAAARIYYDFVSERPAEGAA